MSELELYKGIVKMMKNENVIYFISDLINEKNDYKSRIEKAIPMLKELNIKLKGILNIGIDIKEISDIEDTLDGRSDK